MKTQTLCLLILLFCTCKTFSQATDSLRVYPNPFRDSTTIYYSLEQDDTLTLKMFDLQGRTIYTFHEAEFITSGTYQHTLLGDSLKDGAYLINYQLSSGKRLVVRAVKSITASNNFAHKTNDDFRVYPNPTSDVLNIVSSNIQSISLSDLKGRILKTFTPNKQSISLADMAAGVYLLTVVNTKGERQTVKVIRE
jgi:hypothetical protein